MPPSLTRWEADGAPRSAALFLHGGKPHSMRAVDRLSASWWRMAALARAYAPDAAGRGTATYLLRYAEAGWNSGPDRVGDARWALEQIRGELGDVPVVLVGHSMGARVAVHVADSAHVEGVVALAPWFPADTPVAALRGRWLRAAHGRRDRITSFAATAEFVERARAAGVEASLRDMGPHGHYLLTGVGGWNAFVREAAAR